jgi:hypothetical protein
MKDFERQQNLLLTETVSLFRIVAIDQALPSGTGVTLEKPSRSIAP